MTDAAIPDHHNAASNLFRTIREIEEVVDSKFRPATHLDQAASPWILDAWDDGSMQRVIIILHVSQIYTSVGAICCYIQIANDRRREAIKSDEFILERSTDSGEVQRQGSRSIFVLESNANSKLLECALRSVATTTNDTSSPWKPTSPSTCPSSSPASPSRI